MATLLLALLVALSSASHEEVSPHSQIDISGVWNVQITVTDSGGKIAGVLALIPDSTQRNAWIGLEDATYLGIYAADLKGGGPGSALCPYPMAAARTAGDSIIVVLNPAQDHGSIYLTGRFTGDATVEGQMVETAYGRGRSGTFTMRRKETE